MAKRFLWFAICSLIVAAICAIRTPAGMAESAKDSSTRPRVAASSAASPDNLAQALGIEFVQGSTSTLIVQRDGKRYLVNLVTRSIAPAQSPAETSAPKPARSGSSFVAEQPQGALVFKQNCSKCHGVDGKGLDAAKMPDFTNPAVQASLTDQQMVKTIENGKPGTAMPAFASKLSVGEINAVQSFLRSLNSAKKPGQETSQQEARKSARKIYTPGDDVLFSLPTGRPTDRHGLYVNFAHRFPYFAAFSDQASGGALGGLDSSALPSFGFRYGVTDRLSLSIYREPSLIARPIQFLSVYNLMEEGKGSPLNMAIGLAIQGQNNFSRNFTESLEGIFSRSISSRAQLYLVPTLSINNRRLQQVPTFFSSDIHNLPGHNTFSLGVGGALDIRPTVALVAEVIPTLANGRPLGILRPAYSFGIQKKIWRHAFTFGFTNSPSTMVSERAATRSSFLGQPNADTFGGLFVGFDLTRQVF